MRLVDVHCHLESSHFIDNLDVIIEEASNSGVVKLITSSITPDQWDRSIEISALYSEVECSLGIHPWYISDNHINELDGLGFAKTAGAVAIGEIGLDRKIESPVFDTQVRFFEAQLSVARELNLPVIIHCRGAFNELISSIRRVSMPEAGGIVHSFSGSVELAEQLIPLGLSFSLGGILTYRSSRKRAKMMARIYPDHFMLETDSPDIPPVNMGCRPNVPANIRYNLTAAAEILDISEEEIAGKTTENAVKIFGLKI